MRRVAFALAIIGLSFWVFGAVSPAALLRGTNAFMLDSALAGLLPIGAVIVLVLWLVPKWQVSRLGVPKERQFELETEARKTVAQIIGGAVLLAGLSDEGRPAQHGASTEVGRVHEGCGRGTESSGQAVALA